MMLHPVVAETRRLLMSAVEGLEGPRLETRGADGRWSVAEIVEHLALTYEGTVRGLRRSIENKQPWIAPVSFRQRVIRFAIVELGYFPSGREAPAHVRPSGVSFVEAVSRADAGLTAMDAALVEAAAQFGGDRVPVLKHPNIGAFSVRDWRRFHRIHTRHHVRHIASRVT
ncbi:MAG: DUF1569 domain-containing protein [Acidobacteriota bacterium]